MSSHPDATSSPYRFLFSTQDKKQRFTPTQVEAGSNQFTAPPRFTFSSTPRSQTTPHFITPNKPSDSPAPGAFSAFKSTSTPVEPIDDPTDSSSPVSSPQPPQRRLQNPVITGNDDDDGEEPNAPRTPKRRRLTLTGSHNSPLPLDVSRNTRHQFILPLSPAKDEPELLVPFSPHRHRARDFIPGGYAAAVREWALRAVAGVGNEKNEIEYALIVKIHELRISGGIILLKGSRLAGGQNVQAGEGRFVLPQGELQIPCPGDVLGIKRPTWPVTISGDDGPDEWTMGAEWKILRNLNR
ncbi:MAG: hypothetical protein M1814_005487 [Vezdaea aestivalis]|nr:MAG: hypothetical protein M1814_005487 [Vezdaea aestivalis]